MTLSEDQIIFDYQATREQLESEEDQIRSFQDQEVDGHGLVFIRNEIYKAQENYENTVNKEKTKWLQKMEDNELIYRKKINQIN